MSVLIPETARPNNLHLADDVKVEVVDSDLYDICNRIKEISSSLYIIQARQDEKHSFIIMEHCEDGVDRLCFRVKQLDNRLLERLRRIMAQPLIERLEELEREEYQLEQEAKEEEAERLYEKFGRPMWTQLEHDGFIQRGVSYPKRGIK